MKCVSYIAMIILIIGGLNWGLVGAFNFNLVTFLFGSMPIVAKIIYIVVGISALWGLYMLGTKCCGKSCE